MVYGNAHDADDIGLHSNFYTSYYDFEDQSTKVYDAPSAQYLTGQYSFKVEEVEVY